MKPLDPRLLRYAQSTRLFLVFAIVVGIVTAVVVIVQARLLSGIIVDVTSGGATLDAVSGTIMILLGVFVVRGLLAWLAELAAFRASARAKEQLRQAALERAMSQSVSAAEVSTLITRGIDALDGYFARYLPQLVLAVLVPIAVVATVLTQDLLSTIIIVVTLPLIPAFMILIGLYTRSRVDRQWRTLATLSGHFLDLIAGLPTLKVFGRAKSQVAAIQSIGERYRSTTMGVLRVSFLSSFWLELLATLSVALVAVSVGLRLAEGQIAYSIALFVLLLAPEAYLPLRLVGQHFHAAAEGLGAAERIFTLIESDPTSIDGSSKAPTPTSIAVSNVEYTYPDRRHPALSPTSFVAQSGQITAIVGGSGGGKSTLLSLLLGMRRPNGGSIVVSSEDVSIDLTDCSLPSWLQQCAWVPQNPTMIAPTGAPTIRNVISLGRPEADDAEIWATLSEVGLDADIRALPAGIDTTLAADGTGLSQGQLRRLALARALCARRPVLILDEPTSALDPESEQHVLSALEHERERGCIVLVVAHRPAVLDIANVVVRVDRNESQNASRAIATESTLAATIRSSGW